MPLYLRAILDVGVCVYACAHAMDKLCPPTNLYIGDPIHNVVIFGDETLLL